MALIVDEAKCEKYGFWYRKGDEMVLIEEAIRMIDYFVGFCGHNKNLTKTQMRKLEIVRSDLELLKDEMEEG